MRRLSCILWLLILLMPLRGIAQSLMSVAPPQPGHAVAADAVPCPMHASSGSGDETGSMQPAHGEGHATVSHGCSLCNVCHSAMLPLAFDVPAASALPQSEPIAAHGLGAGRAAPAELFRPPR